MSPRCQRWQGCSPRALKAGASTGPVIGLPWPGASTPGSSRASSDTDPVAARQFQVAKRGGPPRVCLCDRASPGELRLTVRTALPAMRVRSASRNSARWPGVWPGVGMTCQSGRPGTPASGSIGLSPSCPGGEHPAPLDTGQGADDAAGRGQGQFAGVHVHGEVPHAGQFRSRASVVRVHVRQDDRPGAGAGPEQGLRCAPDQLGPAPPCGVDQNPASARLHEVDVRVSPFPGDQAVDPVATVSSSVAPCRYLSTSN